MIINQYTGTLFDSLTQSYGLRQVRLRYNNIEISPRPLMTHNGPTPITDVSFQNSDTEVMDQWTVSVPRATLTASLGGQWATAITPDQPWQVMNVGAGEAEWKRYRTYGQPDFSNADASDRIGLVLVAGFESNESLGFESPYVA